ncbi:acetyltransferase [Clostridium sp. 'White wine YQ']|uniref:acetyltransferase n=1 Tax=Clostridium sp. 'White wine YQ' TaxID=3027474 RepID=UPI0030822F66
MKKILLIGGGGHCKSVLDTLLELDEYHEIGIIDHKSKMGHNILNVKYLGDDDDLLNYYNGGYEYAFVTIGSIGNPEVRIKIFEKIKKIGFKVPNIIDKSAITSRFMVLGQGNYIGKKVVVNADTKIGNCCIINTASVIEHDCDIGDFVHLAPGSIVCGGVKIGNNTHIGANSTIIQYKTIGENVLIGAGSVIVKDITSEIKIFGNPARERNSNE